VTEEKTVTVDIECPSCKGTGLYRGRKERDAAAVVCYKCGGTGCCKYTYKPFMGRVSREDVKRVYTTAGDYMISAEDGKKIKFSQAGASYEDWLAGVEPKPIKDLHCPHQHTNQNWRYSHCEVLGIGDSISKCPNRDAMEVCWEMYEAEEDNK